MLTVGTDAYITVSEADEIIAGCHKGSLSEKWLALSVEEKESIIRTATYKVDCLPIKGCKHNANQELQFPRGMSADIPYKVKLATAEECIAAVDEELLKRTALRQQGVTSVTLGTASESYGNGGSSFLSAESVLLSRQAYNYMRQYIAGSVAIV